MACRVRGRLRVGKPATDPDNPGDKPTDPAEPTQPENPGEQPGTDTPSDNGSGQSTAQPDEQQAVPGENTKPAGALPLTGLAVGGMFIAALAALGLGVALSMRARKKK